MDCQIFDKNPYYYFATFDNIECLINESELYNSFAIIPTRCSGLFPNPRIHQFFVACSYLISYYIKCCSCCFLHTRAPAYVYFLSALTMRSFLYFTLFFICFKIFNMWKMYLFATYDARAIGIISGFKLFVKYIVNHYQTFFLLTFSWQPRLWQFLVLCDFPLRFNPLLVISTTRSVDLKFDICLKNCNVFCRSSASPWHHWYLQHFLSWVFNHHLWSRVWVLPRKRSNWKKSFGEKLLKMEGLHHRR